LFISFVRPKEMNQRKGRRKRKIQPFYPPAMQGHIGATKKSEFHTVSGLPSHLYLLNLILNQTPPLFFPQRGQKIKISILDFRWPQIILGNSDCFEACCAGLL
jgi:hypothetical protein